MGRGWLRPGPCPPGHCLGLGQSPREASDQKRTSVFLPERTGKGVESRGFSGIPRYPRPPVCWLHPSKEDPTAACAPATLRRFRAAVSAVPQPVERPTAACASLGGAVLPIAAFIPRQRTAGSNPRQRTAGSIPRRSTAGSIPRRSTAGSIPRQSTALPAQSQGTARVAARRASVEGPRGPLAPCQH